MMQCISLVNRIITVPSKDSSEEPSSAENLTQSINQTALYSLFIKSIKQHTQGNSFVTSNSISQANDATLANEIINKNNQFLLQLNLMMSQSNSSSNKNLSILNTTTSLDNKNEINWFYLLAKIVIYKSNTILDCLLFSIFKKISQLTPRLFGSLIGPFANQMHTVVLSKLRASNDGQIISTICEFLCSLVENQPGFFQTLACLKIEPKSTAAQTNTLTGGSSSTTAASNEQTETFVEGDRSVLKAIFDLLSDLKKQKNKVTYKPSIFKNNE